MDFPPFCPYCQSRDVVPRATGLKIFGAIGIVVGAAGAFKASLKALQVLRSGSVALPGIALTGIASAVLTAMSASALGCEIGTKAGAQLDRMLLGKQSSASWAWPWVSGTASCTA